MLAYDLGMKGERRLRNGRDPQRMGRQHEARDVATAVDRAINAERLVGVDDRDMRSAEEIEILQRLPGVTFLVAAGNADRVIELEAAFAAPFQVDSAIFAREREIAAARPAA